MIKKFAIPALLAVFAFASCSTDLDVIDDWKETTVVYGVLNERDTAHYIKVTKAFLGEGDAYMMAQEFDSLYYDTTKLVVTLTEVETGITERLQADMSIPKDSSGSSIFDTRQVLYKSLMPLNKNNTYKLDVKNTASGNQVSGQTRLPKHLSISQPSPSAYYLDFVSVIAPEFKVKWTSVEDGKRYQSVMRFHYEEVDKLTGAVIDSTKYIDLVLNEMQAPNSNGGSDLETGFERAQFYRLINNQLAPNSAVRRHSRGVEFIFYVGSEDLNTYIEVNKPSNGIVQDKPDFTNISNGIGIFASRYTQLTKRYGLSSASKDSLCGGQYTRNLGFCDPSELDPTAPCFCD